MAPKVRRSWVWEGLWFLVWAVASSVWCLSAATQLGATVDEPGYLRAGLERWRKGSYESFMAMGTMPLAADVQTLPLYLRERQKGVPYNAENLDHLLPRARAATLLFWWLLLGYGWLIGRRLAGPWGGRLAVALLACEPTLLAHAGLATTDLALAACLLALTYHFRIGRESRWPLRVGVPALGFAFALLAKASTLVFGPIILTVVELERLARRGKNEAQGQKSLRGRLAPLGRFAWDLTQVLLVGFVLALLYCGSDGHPTRSLDNYLQRMADGPERSFLTWFVSLPIFSNAAEGIFWQLLHNQEGGAAYLLGKVHPHGCWYYFPVALSMKLSLSLLALLVLLLVVRPRALANWACLAALILLALSVTCRVQIGVRILLPLFALVATGLSAAAVAAWRYSEGWRRAVLAGATGGVVVWATWSAVSVWPNGLCYTNELWGGTARGYLCLTDSNYDWGQGSKQLGRWQREHGVPNLLIWWFGNDPGFKKLSGQELPLHDLPLQRPTDVLPYVRGHYLAVSLLNLHGPKVTPAALFLRTQRPIGRTATFFIYDFTRR
jgi:hypothetical protein